MEHFRVHFKMKPTHPVTEHGRYVSFMPWLDKGSIGFTYMPSGPVESSVHVEVDDPPKRWWKLPTHTGIYRVMSRTDLLEVHVSDLQKAV